jgi:hypothetical protein
MTPDPELDAAVEARDIDAVVDRLSERFAMPGGHDEWVLDMLMDGVPDDVDEEGRARIRAYLRDHLDEIVPADLREGEAS